MTNRHEPANDFDRSFLGAGWAFPVSLDASGSVALVEHEEDIEQSIRILLETNLGERVMRPEFGASLRSFVFESLSTTTLAMLRHRVEETLVTWEPRITVDRVTATVAPIQRNRIDVSIDYRVRATNTFYNLVYPFYLGEGEQP